jgi:NADH-quinone oxidoreductase subunit L
MLPFFSPNDYTVIAIILGMPLLGAFVNGVWGKRLGLRAVRLMALAAVGASFVASVLAFGALADLAGREKGEHVKLVWNAWQWMTTSAPSGATVPIEVKFSIDQLSGVMMLIVTGVGFLIHLYATSYMKKDPGYARFFAYLNLFIFAMLVLILADNLPVLFVGWEGVGLCSYLLIGFWYENPLNAAAGKKAFIANRVGDFGLLCAMFLLVYYTGALDWNGIANGATSLVHPGDAWRVQVWPLGNGSTYTGFLHFLQPTKPWTISAATAVSLALLLGCTGKSAQIPLYVWLPDAMAGPTPVSALIHAATMVTAGVYLICRLSFVFVLSPFTMMVIAIVGASTALLAASIALVQTDIKKVLAYSTVSQLGFMFLGVGVGAFTAGFFHVFTHAFFKACLFLCAGSVIHAMHARIHDDDKAQDIRNMGGLRKWLPLTHGTFAAATAAIIGLPLTSGFFSKDEILYRAFVDHTVNPEAGQGMLRRYRNFEPPTWLGPAVYAVAVAAALMTAFYMCRLYFLTFWGDFKGWAIGRPSLIARQELAAVHAERAHAIDASHDTELANHPHGEDDDEPEHHEEHHEDLASPGYPPHESPWQMTIPLIILAAFSLFAGVLDPGFGLLRERPMEHWLEPVFKAATEHAVLFAHNNDAHWAEHMEWPLAAGGVGAFAIGTALAWWMYIAKKGEPAQELAKNAQGLYRLLLAKWRVDELYEATVIAAVDSLAETSAAFDRFFVDGIIARLTSLVVASAGTVLRAFQNGIVHVYAAMMVVGLAAVGWFFAVPHPNATIAEAGNDDYTITAAPGVGYTYRWDANGDGTPDKKDFGSDATLKVHVEPGKTLDVNLEVQNSFGARRTKTIHLARPHEPTSSL